MSSPLLHPESESAASNNSPTHNESLLQSPSSVPITDDTPILDSENSRADLTSPYNSAPGKIENHSEEDVRNNEISVSTIVTKNALSPAVISTRTQKKRGVPTPFWVAGIAAVSALSAIAWRANKLVETRVINVASTRNDASPAPVSSPKSVSSITSTPRVVPQPSPSRAFVLPGFLKNPSKESFSNSNQNITADKNLPTTVLPRAASPNVTSANTNPLAENRRAALQAQFEKAVAAQRAKRPDEALTLYRQILQTRPEVVEVRVNLALLLLEMKRPDEALSQLQKARQIDRRNAAVAFQLAQLLIEKKRLREAVDPLKSVVAMAPKNPQGWATLAQTQAALNRRSDSISSWKRVARLMPNDARAPMAIASLAAETKSWRDAENFARRAVEISRKNAPKDSRATFLLGRVLASRQKYGEAESVLRDGLKSFPDALEIGNALSEVRWQRGDKKGAIATLKSLLTRVPASRNGGAPRAQLLAQIARTQTANKQFREAAQSWQSASELLPKNAELRALWGESLVQSGDKKSGITQLRKALSLEPKREELRWTVARALASNRDWQSADIEYSTLRRANAKANREPSLLAEHAQVQEKNKQPQAAISTWQQLAKVAPKDALPLLQQARLQQARLLHALKRDNEALRVYNRVLNARADEPNALLGAAQIENTRNPTRALKLWTQLAQTRVDFTPAYGRAMFLAVKQNQAQQTANALKAPLRRQTENRAAFGAVLRGLIDANEIEAAQSFVKEFRNRFPKAIAPQWAQAALDVELKKREIARREKSNTARTKPTLSTTPSTSSTRSPDLTLPNARSAIATPSVTPSAQWTPRPLATPNVAPNASLPNASQSNVSPSPAE